MRQPWATPLAVFTRRLATLVVQAHALCIRPPDGDGEAPVSTMYCMTCPLMVRVRNKMPAAVGHQLNALCRRHCARPRSRAPRPAAACGARALDLHSGRPGDSDDFHP